MKAFAERFNDPKKTAFIDAYGLGKWGEGHNVCYEQNNAVSDKTETDDYIEFRVKIPKTVSTEPKLKVLSAKQA